jgi:hypothetical protein
MGIGRIGYANLRGWIVASVPEGDNLQKGRMRDVPARWIHVINRYHQLQHELNWP